MLPHQRSQRCQPSASLPSAPPTGSCSWGSVPQWLHLSLQITFKKLSLDSMPQAEMAGYPSKLQLGDKDPPHPWPLQSPSRFRHPGLEHPTHTCFWYGSGRKLQPFSRAARISCFVLFFSRLRSK